MKSLCSIMTGALWLMCAAGIHAQSAKYHLHQIDSIHGEKIVITGYGTQKQREVTGSVATLDFDEFNRGNINIPVQLIQGKVSGLDISKPGGDPNGSYYLRLRGLNTISASTQPLVIVDGVIDASLDNVDPNDIESFNVIKDGSAAIYGTRGSNGVIIVTTKKGKKGTAVIDYNVYLTEEKVARNAPAMNAAEWRALNAELNGLGTDFGESTDWFKEIEQTAISQVHNISLSGGTERTTYRASVNYRKGDGVEIKTGYTQLNGRINIVQKALNEKLTLDLNLGATERESQYGFAEPFRYASIFNPTAPVKSSDPEYTKYDGFFQQLLFDYYNPVSILELNTNDGRNRIMNLSLKGTYDILKGFSVEAFYSMQSSSGMGGQYYDKNDYWKGILRNGLASQQEDNSANQLFELTTHYTADLSSSVNIAAIGGYSYQEFVNEGFYAEGGNFITDDFAYNNLSAALDFKNGKGTVTSYKNSNKLIAFFGHVNLDINNIWFLTASARYDGSSRFGTSSKWGFFPSVGAGMDFSKLLNAAFINNLKFRADYGVTGNQPPVSYMSLQIMGQQGNSYYNGNFIPAYTLMSNANPDLKWERKGEFDVGSDYSLFTNRLSGSFDYYTRTATDLLFQYYVPVPPNLYYEAWLNLGEIKSSGLELSLNLNVVKKGDFSYSIAFTRSHIIKNTLVSLSGSYNGTMLKYGRLDLGDMGSPGQCCVTLVRSEEGKPIGQLQAYVFEEIDKNGQMILEDQNLDGQIDHRDLAIVGNGLPEYLTGFGNELTYKNWDFNIFFRSVSGYELVNSYRAFYEVPDYIIAYNLPKTATDMRNSETGTLLNNTSGILTSIDIENASFISLDNISLGYNFSLPESSQFRSIRMYFGGNNLFFFTRYKGSDPNPRYADNENLGTYNSPLVPGVDRRNTWPRTRSVTFGANLVF
jgi:TonB-dependent starch-binding outer membrane protein SusC